MYVLIYYGTLQLCNITCVSIMGNDHIWIILFLSGNCSSWMVAVLDLTCDVDFLCMPQNLFLKSPDLANFVPIDSG